MSEDTNKTPPAPPAPPVPPVTDDAGENVDVTPALEPTAEERAVAKLKKGQYTPTRGVCCLDNKIKGRGEPITPDDVPGGKATFDNLVKKGRIFKVGG